VCDVIEIFCAIEIFCNILCDVIETLLKLLRRQIESVKSFCLRRQVQQENQAKVSICC